jgi:hypothetical protein
MGTLNQKMGSGCTQRPDNPEDALLVFKYARELVEWELEKSASGLGVDDKARAEKALKGIVGKRLPYRRPDKAPHA